MLGFEPEFALAEHSIDEVSLLFSDFEAVYARVIVWPSSVVRLIP
jgi:galactose-1-phosphate uridylyltransferase